MDLGHWPYDQPEEELQIMADVLSRCETQDQAEKMLGMFLLGDILVAVLSSPPVWRERWWQFWRLRRPS